MRSDTHPAEFLRHKEEDPMKDSRSVWEEFLEEAIPSWEADPEEDPARSSHPTNWVVDCMMGCYNFTEPEED